MSNMRIHKPMVARPGLSMKLTFLSQFHELCEMTRTPKTSPLSHSLSMTFPFFQRITAPALPFFGKSFMYCSNHRFTFWPDIKRFLKDCLRTLPQKWRMKDRSSRYCIHSKYCLLNFHFFPISKFIHQTFTFSYYGPFIRRTCPRTQKRSPRDVST